MTTKLSPTHRQYAVLVIFQIQFLEYININTSNKHQYDNFVIIDVTVTFWYISWRKSVGLRAFVNIGCVAILRWRQWRQGCHRDYIYPKHIVTELRPYNVALRAFVIIGCVAILRWRQWRQGCHRDYIYPKYIVTELRPYNVALSAFVITGCVAILRWRQWRQGCHRDYIYPKHIVTELRPYNVALSAFVITGCVAILRWRQWRQGCHRDYIYPKHIVTELRPYNVALSAFVITGCVTILRWRQWRQGCHRDYIIAVTVSVKKRNISIHLLDDSMARLVFLGVVRFRTRVCLLCLINLPYGECLCQIYDLTFLSGKCDLDTISLHIHGSLCYLRYIGIILLSRDADQCWWRVLIIRNMSVYDILKLRLVFFLFWQV